MTNLSKDPSTALLAIVHPVIRRQMSGIDAVIQSERLRDRAPECLHFDDHRCKSPIEASHQSRTIRRLYVQISTNNFAKLSLGQAQRFLAKDILTCLERS